MALPTASGTETLHTILLEDVVNSAQTLITGVQHHVYTVLSVIIYCVGRQDGDNDSNAHLYLTGYGSRAGASGHDIYIVRYDVEAAKKTFVFNDKFSFNGYEPSSNTQVARAAQAGSTPQYLKMITGHASTIVDVTCTYIDQNNA